MNRMHQKRLIGGIVCCLVALAVWVCSRRYTYIQVHQGGHVGILRENRLTGAVAFFNEETKQWDSPEESKQEFASNADERVTAPAADFPGNHPEKIFMYAGQLHQDCLLADAIVHSAPEARQFTRKDFQSAERCVAYVTGALDALPGKVEIIGGKRYEFAFGNQKVIVAIDSFNRYMAAHPESANSSGVDTLVRALVNEHVANWVEFPWHKPL